MSENKPDLMAELAEVPCSDCGMPCKVDEYHPFAACLMFKACHNSEVVRANLMFVVDSGKAAHHAELEAVVMDKQRLDWAEDHAHALDWDLHDPMKRVVRGHDGAEFCGDNWRELIDQAMRNSAREG